MVNPAGVTGIITPPAGQSINQIYSSRCILIGDSLFANGFGNVGVNTGAGSFVVASNGVATVSTSTAGAHQVQPFNYFHIYNAGQSPAFVSAPYYSYSINGAVIQALTVSSTTAMTFSTAFNGQVMAAGDYSQVNGNGWFIQSLTNVFDSTWFDWLQWFNKSNQILVGTYAMGGTTTVDCMSLIGKYLAGPAFDSFFCQIGTNDVAGATTGATAATAANTALANIQTICTALIGAGKIGYIGCPNPVNSTASGTPQARNAGITMLRQGILRLCSENRPYLVPVDTCEAVIDGTNASGFPLANLVSTNAGDGVHLSSQGAIQVGRFVKPYGLQNVYDIQPVSILEDDNTYSQAGAPYKNVLKNGNMAGVAGTMGTGQTGTIATGWTSANYGGAGTVTNTGQFTKTAIAGSPVGNLGYAQKIVCTGMASGDSLTYNSTQFASELNSNLGKWYQAGFSVYVESNSSGFAQIVGQLFLAGNSAFSSVYLMQGQTQNNGWPLLTGDQLQFVSNPVFIPTTIDGSTATNITSAALYFYLNFNAAAGAVAVEVSNAFMRQIDNPYAGYPG